MSVQRGDLLGRGQRVGRGRYQEFGICVLLHMLLPLAPLMFEYVLTRSIDDNSLLLVTSMYTMAIGATSDHKFLFVLMLLVGFGFSIVYALQIGNNIGLLAGGAELTSTGVIPESITAAKGVLIGVFIVHFVERFNRHILERQPYSNVFAK